MIDVVYLDELAFEASELKVLFNRDEDYIDENVSKGDFEPPDEKESISLQDVIDFYKKAHNL